MELIVIDLSRVAPIPDWDKINALFEDQEENHLVCYDKQQHPELFTDLAKVGDRFGWDYLWTDGKRVIYGDRNCGVAQIHHVSNMQEAEEFVKKFISLFQKEG